MNYKGYMYFCEVCGIPGLITPETMGDVFPNKHVKGIYCGNCSHLNPIPEHLRAITDELIKFFNEKGKKIK